MNNAELLSRAVLDSLATGIIYLGSIRNQFNEVIDFQWILINSSAGQFMGCSEKEIINKTLVEFFPQIQSDDIFQKFLQVIESGESIQTNWSFDYLGKSLSSQIIITKFQDGILINLLNDREVIIQIPNQSVGSNINQDRLDYEKIFEESKEVMLLVRVEANDEFTIVRDNLSHRTKTGIHLYHSTSRSMQSVFGELLAQDLIPYYKRCLDETILTFQEVRTVMSVQRIWLTTLTLIQEPGKLRHILSSSSDITDRKKIEEELDRYRKDLEESGLRLKNAMRRSADASRAKGEFLANMSHEIRTPLNGVIGMSDLLRETELDCEQQQYTDVIRSSSKMLLRIINDILDFSNMEAGRLQLDIQLFHLATVIESSINIFRSKATDKKIDLRFLIEDDVPQVLKGDPGRLVQILVNLIGNAVKFTEGGQIDLSVTKVSESRDGNIKLHFLVRDTGIGVPESKVHLLFQPFSQIDSSFTRRYEGTGLGLSICDRLTRMMNGIIGYNSNPRGGSEFWFTAMFQLSEENYIQPQAIDKPIIRSNLPKLKILIVEDNVVNQKVARSILRKIGYDADISSNGQDAIDKLKKDYYNLVLMDIQMPVLDGIEATKRIRYHESSNEKSPTVIIAMTAHTMEGDKERCLQVGMNDYISKPIEKSDIEKMILRWT